ncbi:MAG: hypothetical protein JWN78_3108 [Bacteroidota bacterium]|nr:hypothetical protein [Bacteroidota bacterium]
MQCMLSLTMYAQSFTRFDYLKVTDNNSVLQYPWTGGLNSVQFGKADVNHDGKKDLVAYDKSNNKFCVFLSLATNSTVFKFESAYATHFPPISGWMIMKDYNCDGIEDIFTYNGVGNLKVYTGYYDHDTLNYTLQQDGFFYHGSGIFINVYCSDVIKPAIVDVNNDGDPDIISFNVSGNRIIYYENQRVELGLACDSLFFAKSDNCWGNVRDTFSAMYALRDTCSFKFNRPANNNNVLHTGSTIEGIDVDNNGAIDVLVGSVSLNSITMLYNKGVPSYASVLKQDVNYPSYDVPYNTSSFAAPYFTDVDNDGKTDLLVSTFDANAANINNIWYYKNQRSDSIDLRLQKKNFLLDNMIDAGENSNPCFFDVDGDGLKDILLGSGGYKDFMNSDIFKLRYYKNTGTSDYPEFNLQDDDFLNISNLNVRDIFPAAGDIDNDHDSDLVVGLSDGRMLWWENIASQGNPPLLFYRGILKDSAGNEISIGANATPYLIDLNRDGKTDLVTGERNGNLDYYRGTSADSAKFSFVTDSLGKVRIKSVNSNFGFTQPCIADVNNDGKYDLILGTNFEGLQFYNNIESHLNDSFSLTSPAVSEDLGTRTTAVIDDITNDGKLELLTGNIDGGLIIFSQDPPPFRPTAIKNSITEKLNFTIYPNPADHHLQINLNENSKNIQLQLFNSLGQQIVNKKIENVQAIDLNTNSISNGIYLLKISDGVKEGIQKIIIQH